MKLCKDAPHRSNQTTFVQTICREQLESLIKLGHYYSQLANFVEAACCGIDDAQRDSIYLVALANGISGAVKTHDVYVSDSY